MIKYVLCIVYILFSVSGLTLIKIGSLQPLDKSIIVPIIDLNLSKATLGGILCYGISFCLYLGVISKFDLGLIIPLLGGIINIAILLISFFILKEQLTYNVVLGAVIIIIGIVIMNLNNK